MNTLISMRTNISYSKKGEVYRKFNEIILLCDKPTYRPTNEGEVIRERGVEELRFFIANDKIDDLIKLFETIKKAKEEDLL